MIRLLRLYPRGWRARYGNEMKRLLEQESWSFHIALDLVAGAVDAHLNPQWTPTHHADEGDTTMNQMIRACRRSSLSRAQALAEAAWMIGGCLAAVALSWMLRASFPRLAETILYSAFPVVYLFASMDSRPMSSSRGARFAIAFLLSAVVVAIMAAAIAVKGSL